MKRAKRSKHEHLPDGEPQKKYPNGIAETVLAIQLRWLSALQGKREETSRPEFVDQSNFVAVYEAVCKKYPGITNPSDPFDLLNDIIQQRHDLSYYKLRALAEFVGLPLGVFIVFTHLFSAERDGDLAECRKVLSDIERIAAKAQKFLEAAPQGTGVFVDRDGFPNMVLLKEWRDLHGAVDKV